MRRARGAARGALFGHARGRAAVARSRRKPTADDHKARAASMQQITNNFEGAWRPTAPFSRVGGASRAPRAPRARAGAPERAQPAGGARLSRARADMDSASSAKMREVTDTNDRSAPMLEPGTGPSKCVARARAAAAGR